MAKTAEDIKKELVDSINTTDKTLDTSQGPIPDCFINPQSGQLANASQDAESLRQLFTFQFDNAITDDEVRSSLANYGSAPGAGTKASHIQYFMRFTKPLVDITIPVGTLVSNAGGNLVYRVVNSGTILASTYQSYYNATRKTYEIGLLVEAVGVGSEYNLPEYRITSMSMSITGIDATENRVKSEGGNPTESRDSQISRLKTSLLGINLGSPGGIKNLIRNSLPEVVTDVSIVQPHEQEFVRNVTGPALDIYCMGSRAQVYSQIYVALGGETSIVLEKSPVMDITSVMISRGSTIISQGFVLVQDTSLETGYSLISTNSVLLCDKASLPEVIPYQLISDDVVTVTYNYNKSLEDVYTVVFDSSDSFLFKTDILIRQPFPVYPILGGEIQSFSSYSKTEVEQNVLAFFTENFNFTIFTDIMYPEVIRQRVITEVSGVQSFKMTDFRRSSGSLMAVEPIVYRRNETSVFSTDYYSIEVVG